MRDDSSVNFERVICRIVLSNWKLLHHIFTPPNQPKRTSDSGGLATGPYAGVISDDVHEDIMSTTQADMNVSGGKTGVKCLASQASIDKAIWEDPE